MQIPLALATLAIAFTHPAESVKWTGILALVIAFCSATQDIAISAYRIEIIPRDETTKISHASATDDRGLVDGLRAAGRGPVLPGRPAGLDLEPDLRAAGRHVDPDHGRPSSSPARAQQHRERFREAEEKYERALAAEGRPRACGRASRPGWR